jgi:hypothetical protein
MLALNPTAALKINATLLLLAVRWNLGLNDYRRPAKLSFPSVPVRLAVQTDAASDGSAGFLEMCHRGSAVVRKVQRALTNQVHCTPAWGPHLPSRGCEAPTSYEDVTRGHDRCLSATSCL